MPKTSSDAGRARILEISEQLFTERGYNAVSIRDISQACKLTKAALYYYFPSKDALYAEVIDQYAHRLKKQMWEAGQREGSFIDRLVAILTEYVLVTADRRAYMFQYGKIKPQPKKTTAQNFHREFLEAMLYPVDQIIQQAVEAGELPPLQADLSPASMLVGMVHGMLAHQYLTGNSQGAVEKIPTVVDIFWRGLSGDPGTTGLDDMAKILGVQP